MSVRIEAKGLAGLAHYFDEFPKVAEQAAVYAMNDVVGGFGLKVLRQEMRKQVDFPKGYLEGDRVKVARKALRGRLEVVIRGRDRPTSLARFALPGATVGSRKGVTVRVAPSGPSKFMRRAFLMRLRRGQGELGNVGLAMRLDEDEDLKASHGAQYLGKNLWLLYGPSVDQVLGDSFGKVTPEILARLEREFLRQFGRLGAAVRG